MLYDLQRDERDACGIGFVADSRGRSSRSIVEAALEGLCRVKHRGAVASDSLTGDGAGLLTPIPRRLLQEAARLSTDLDETRLGAAMVFLDPDDPDPERDLIEAACAGEGLHLEAWRSVPVNEGALGSTARSSAPAIAQGILSRPVGVDEEDAERRAFRARRSIEREARSRSMKVYVASLSFRTITYKALCAADQLASFYLDLADERYEGWFALFHQRYSTNTAPTWERAQPFRFLGHNGEINTIRGNAAAMHAREGRLGSEDLAPEDLLHPALDPTSSDSGMLDEALELLVRGGRDLGHSATMLVPPAWEDVLGLDPDVRDFYRYHSCLMEPWDGPAALVFADGLQVGAGLDRNGLRPLRVSVCEDGFITCASEAGAVPTRGHGRVRRTRIGPGQLLLVDPDRGGVVEDAAAKRHLAARRPYGAWVADNLSSPTSGTPLTRHPDDVAARQVAAGFTKEELTVVLRPMGTDAHEPTSSMGDDTAQPPLAANPRPVFSFLKQRFAQVTNPPIDHLRERHVMSVSTTIGRRSPVLHERPGAAAVRRYATFLLFPSALDDLTREGASVLDATFPIQHGRPGLRAACERLAAEAEAAAAAGTDLVIVSDRAVTAERAPVPSALAAGAVHHALLRTASRSLVGVVADASDARETHHVACLLTNGADAVCPRLALETIVELVARGRLGGDVGAEQAQRNFFDAIEDGVLKVMSKMGISTIDSYRGAQIVEAVGLGPDVIDLCFPGISSRIGGLDFEQLCDDVLTRHRLAFDAKPVLPVHGIIKFKKGGDYHAYNPDVVDALHQIAGSKESGAIDLRDREMDAAHELRRAVKGDGSAYGRFASLVEGRPPAEPRDLLEMIPLGPPVPLEEVEDAGAIARRFSTGAMSHGALSAEAHETLAIAMNLIGGMANTGEGGEAPERYTDARNSGIKQIASGRFGVTPAYVAHARELQIKMAQGSKPGEGGQLPGVKVSYEIAKLRHTVPGVALISPPPHHDIYSIEDLAQLIFDLRQANPRADVSVKLVSSEGVGTIAAGVVKALADVVHVAGADGGTGASPLSSIKNAGLPWEIGLAETQAALSANGLRSRARIRVDGGLKTGRDVLIAALLGADEYSFGTAVLVAEGCILVRTCHRDTCPVGIATQNPALRAKYAGTPEMVARYLTLVAEQVRGLLASLGLRSLDEAVGRTELLRTRSLDSERQDSLTLTSLLDTHRDQRRFERRDSIHPPRSGLGDRLFGEGFRALENDERIDLSYAITTADRAVGARLGCAAASQLQGRHHGTVRASFEGEAGQSFGAFLDRGIDLTLTGEANDYVCKGMAGGSVAIRPPANDAGDAQLVGNTVLYGATGGRLFVAGRAGERFAVRNSGAVAVVEGTGDHACEYMTAGAVVILGPTGMNLGAGMSGGEVYVMDPDATIGERINPQLIGVYEPTQAQIDSLGRVLNLHVAATGSVRAATLLHDWDRAGRLFKRLAPKAEIARLEALFEGTEASWV